MERSKMDAGAAGWAFKLYSDFGRLSLLMEIPRDELPVRDIKALIRSMANNVRMVEYCQIEAKRKP